MNDTSVYVRHDQIEAMTLSDRIVVMNAGIIEQIGTPVQIYRSPNSRFVADFIGRANFVPGEVREKSNGKLSVNVLGETLELTNIQRSFNQAAAVPLIIRTDIIR